MSTLSATGKGLEAQVKVYDGNRLLAAATCTLWLDDKPRHGAIAVPGNQNWLGFEHLTLDTADGVRYSILPRRAMHSAGQQQVMTFQIEADAASNG